MGLFNQLNTIPRLFWPFKNASKNASYSYLGAPQLDSPVERGGNKQVRKIQRPRSCVTVDPCNGPMVALKHLTDARFAVECTD